MYSYSTVLQLMSRLIFRQQHYLNSNMLCASYNLCPHGTAVLQLEMCSMVCGDARQWLNAAGMHLSCTRIVD